MRLHSETLSVEGIVHWANKLGGFLAGEASLESSSEDWGMGVLACQAGSL